LIKHRQSGEALPLSLVNHQTTAAMTDTDVDEPAESGSKTPSTTTTTISDDGSDDNDDHSAWLSNEPHHPLSSIEEERVKIREILSLITPEERSEIERVDTSIPIRHLRAVKVSDSPVRQTMDGCPKGTALHGVLFLRVS
jgi:hypothetical protein